METNVTPDWKGNVEIILNGLSLTFSSFTWFIVVTSVIRHINVQTQI